MPENTFKLNLTGSGKEARARLLSDAKQREAAGKHEKSIIVSGKDLTGEYDASRLLMTTMGGVPRKLTRDDLASFRHNVRQVQTRYKSGIRAKQVIDLSLKDDIGKSNLEIRMAVPVSANKEQGGGLKVRFMTNSGPDSDVNHHHVLVNFMAFETAASGGRGNAKKSATWLRKEPLKIECTCGRWRYWYRYIATIGKFNAGRDETGYPKIRNPNLSGVACKHILRVMHEVETSGSVLSFLTRIIQKVLDTDNTNVILRNRKKDAEEALKQQQEKGSDVGETTARREKDRIARRERYNNAKEKMSEAATKNKRQKEGTKTRAAKAKTKAADSEEAFLKEANELIKKLGIKITAEIKNDVLKKYRSEHAT